ncbi:MAG: hypothetical protein ACP5KN_14495, partial [Armatimonadota bacterium]
MALEESVAEMELTVEQVRKSPLELLNAEEQELRRFLRECVEQALERYPTLRQALRTALGLDGDEEVSDHVEHATALTKAFRCCFEAITAEPLKPEELAQAVLALDEGWRQVRGPRVEHFRLLHLEHGLLDTPKALTEALAGGDPECVWLRRVPVPSNLEHLAWFALVLSPGENTWLQLANLLEQTWAERMRGEVLSVLVCPICERVQLRGRSDQVYCSRACANLAWQR